MSITSNTNSAANASAAGNTASRSSSVSSAASPTSAAPPAALKKKFPCAFPGCGKSFSRSEHLHRHALNHQDGNNTCQRCSAHFRRRDLLERHLARHKEKDDEAGGEGLGVLATRKRLWRDENGNIVNSRRPSLADAKEIARKRMENRRNSESAAAAAAKTTTAAQVELGTVQAQSQRPQSGMLRQAQHQMQMKRERPQHLKTRSLGRIPTAHHPISIQTQQQMYMHQSNIRSPIEDFPDYMQQQQHSWGNGIHSPPLSVPSLSVGGSSYSNSSSTGTTPSSEHDPADESDRAKHHLLTPPLESNSWPDLQPHIPLFTASPSPENFEYPSPGLHSQPWSNNPSSATPFSHYPPTQQSHDVLHYDGLDLDLDLEIFKQDPDNDDRLGSVDWAVPPEQVWHTRERPFGCGAGSGGLGPRGLGFGSAC